MNGRLRYWIGTLCFFGHTLAGAQIPIDNFNLEGDTKQWYDNTVGIENIGILEGTFFLMPAQSPAQHQVYKNLVWAQGDLLYKGQLYSEIDMMYNIYSDQLILRNLGVSSSMDQAILPDQNCIPSFTIHDDRFLYLSDPLGPNMTPGFYQSRFDGKSLDLLIKWTKKQNTESNRVQYEEETSVFLSYNGQYSKYNGERSLLKLFPEHKREIKKYIRTNMGYLKKQVDENLVQAVIFCDKLRMTP
ncbi:MAG: hypothetical protein JXR07_10535 [Reichenbachiella sp.]